jgi:hypothetical protein
MKKLLSSFLFLLIAVPASAQVIITPSPNVSAVTGVLPVPNGGTGFSSYTIGDILQADSASTLAKLNSVATGNALISGGVGTISSWGKIGLTTHVSGTLPVGNGGTGKASWTQGIIPCLSATTTFAEIASAATGQVLTSSGSGSCGSYSASPSLSNVTISVQHIATQGTITASTPAYTHTATWNNAAITFVDDFRNITSTASAAGSLLAEWQVGGVDQFSVTKGGTINANGAVNANSASQFGNIIIGVNNIVWSGTGAQINFSTNTITLQATTVTGSAKINAVTGFQFNGANGGSGSACTVFQGGIGTTCAEPNANYSHLILEPALQDAGFFLPSFSQWTDLNNKVIALTNEINFLKGIK